MKKAFKLIGLALIATSLTFVACSKDDDDDTTNTEPNKEDTTTESIKVKVGNSDVSLVKVRSLYSTYEGDFVGQTTLAGSKTETSGRISYEFPVMNLTFSYPADEEWIFVSYTGADEIAKYNEIEEDVWCTFNNDVNKFEVKEIDATTHKYTVTISGVMHDNYTYETDKDAETLADKTFSIELKNFTLDTEGTFENNEEDEQ